MVIFGVSLKGKLASIIFCCHIFRKVSSENKVNQYLPAFVLYLLPPYDQISEPQRGGGNEVQ